MLLVRRYLQGFGPAAPADIASWAGLPVTIVKDIVAVDLRRFRDESGRLLVDGAVTGTWRYERGRVETTPFQPLSTADRREVADEADRLTPLHA